VSNTTKADGQNGVNNTSWKFPKAFWTANIVELFERAAYYGVFIAITLYLSRIVGFDDIEAAWIGGVFSLVYISYLLLPVHLRIKLDLEMLSYLRLHYYQQDTLH